MKNILKNILKNIKNLTFTLVLILGSIWSANAINYYSKATGNLNVLSTWGTATDGTGAAPANFTTAGNVFFIRNNATPTISANWTVSGAGSKVVVGDGTNPSNFNVDGALVLTATIDVSANATLTLTTSGNLGNIILGTLASTSTVNYAGGDQTMRDYNYGNLILSGTGTKSWAIGANNRTIAGNLIINSGVSLTTSGNRTVFVTGTTSVTGTLTLGGTSAKTFTGDVTLNTGGIWNETAIAAINFAGNFTNNATTFTASTGVHTFSGATKTIGGATATVIPSMAITGTRSIALGTTVTVNTALSGAGALTNLGTLNSGGTLSTTTLANAGTMTKSGTGATTTALANLTNIGTLNLTGSGAIAGITNNAGGIVNLVDSGTIASFNNATATSTLNISDLTPTITTLTATAAGNTVNYSGAGAQTVKDASYGNLSISASGIKTWTLAGNRIIGGNLIINSGVALTTSGNRTISVTGATSVTGTLTLGGTSAKTFTGDVTLNTGGIWNETAIAAINFAGNFTNNATTFTANTGVHTFSGATKTIGGATATVIPSMAITGTRSIALGTTVTVNTALSGAGALTNLGTLNSGGTLSTTTLANAGTMTKSGTGAMTTALANLTNIGTLNLTGSGAITGITNNAGGIVNLVDSGTIASFNNATATSTLNISDLTPTITTLTATSAGNTVNYSGAGVQTVKSTTYSKLNLSGGNTKTFNATTTVANMLSIASGTNVNLTAALTHSCLGLSLGGIAQPTGAYGGTGSTGTTINTTYFTATSGKINNNCVGVVITTQPATPATTCDANGIQTIAVAATGTGLIYSWRKASIPVTNGSVFSGQGTPTLTLTNPTLADIGSYDVVVSGSCASSVTSTAVTVSVSVSTEWTGNSDTSWTNAANWSSCGVPNSNSNVIINIGPNQPVIAANVTINSLSINSSAALTVNSGSNLTVTNAIANAGTLNVKSNANLIQSGATNSNSGAGVANIERNSSSLYRLDYTMWSSPVTGSQTLANFSPATTSTRFYTYNTSTDLYNATSSTGTFATAKGYLIRMPNTDPLPGYDAGTATLSYPGTFTGTPNNGDITFTMSTEANGYNAVGNPYPSTLNIDNFIGGNTGNINGTLWFWRKKNDTNNTTSYSTCTTAGCTLNNNHPYSNDNFISVGQGFIVKATSTTLNFTNSMRVANNQNQFFRTKQIERNRIWLNLFKDASPVNQMMVAYMTGATSGVDQAIDGSYFNDSPTALNSLISNEEFAIQGRSLPFDGTDVVPLAFKTLADGSFTIAIDHVDGLFAAGQDIYLVDSKTGTETNLKEGAYAFTATAGVDNARFSLKYQKTLKVDAPVFNENNIVVYKNEGTLYVNSKAKTIQSVQVYDIQGRLIAALNNVKANTATIKNLKATNQVLIVKISDENNNVVSKKVLN